MTDSSLYPPSGRLALQNKIKELQDEALSLGITFDNIKKPKKKKRPKRWGKDRKLVEEKLDEKRGDFFKAFLAQHGRPAKVCCSECAVQLDHVVVCCNDCKEYFCSECDFLFHFKRPFHFRESCLDLEAVPLLPTEFLDATGSTKCTSIKLNITAFSINFYPIGTFLIFLFTFRRSCSSLHPTVLQRMRKKRHSWTKSRIISNSCRDNERYTFKISYLCFLMANFIHLSCSWLAFEWF